MKNCCPIKKVVKLTMAASALFLSTVAKASLVALSTASFQSPNVTFSEVPIGTPMGVIKSAVFQCIIESS